MKKTSRILLAILSLGMLSSLFLPLWQIQLWAPQYPEGLNMKIWHNHLSGSFDIINGLNHYIGMKLIKEEMFPELAYIGILICIYAAIGLLTAITGKKVMLKIFIATGIVYGLAALYDFYQWGYDYGHNLDPNAAIKVPGMSYQPPVVGYKNLLNFTAYSGPDNGGWVIIGVSLAAMALLVWEYLTARAVAKSTKHTLSMAAGFTLICLLTSCSANGPAPLRYGKDECDHCRMTLTDTKYGAELITTTNKVFKFDDVICMVNYMKNNSALKVEHMYIVDFSHEGQFTEAINGFFLHSEMLSSPMGGQVASFATAADRDAAMKNYKDAEAMDWNKVRALF